MLAKPGEITRASGAGIHKSGGGAGTGECHRIDTDRGTAPIHMGVQVDQPGGHHLASYIANIGPRWYRQVHPDLGDNTL